VKRFFPFLVLLLLFCASCAEKDAIRKQEFRRGAEASQSSRAKYHVVKRGDTLYSIARRYGVPLATLKNMNGINDERGLRVGSRLVVAHSSRSSKPGIAEAYDDAEDEEEDNKIYTPLMKGKFIWPLKTVAIGSGFGIRHNVKHDGIDLRGAKGSPIMASADGKVIFSGWGPSGYGKIVILKHDKRTITVYAHNDDNLVKEGVVVKQGEQVATVGRTGRATGFHCHFEIRVDRKPVNPKKYLPPLE